MTSRATLTLGTLFVMCLLLSACDMEDVLRVSQGASVEQGDTAPAERGRADTGTGDAADDAPADNEDRASVEDDASEVPVEAGQTAVDDQTAAQPDSGSPALDCDHVISAEVEEADGASNYAGVDPGDTVCVDAGSRGPLELRNFHGAPGSPISFVNHGGTVTIRGGGGDYAGIEVEHSDHIRVTGTGERQRCGAEVPEGSQQCGIRILGAERSLTGKVVTDHIRVDHVEMGDTTQSAVSIKDNAMGRGEWIARGIVLDRTYIHDVRDEGVYVGSSDYATGEYHVLHGVHLAHNLVVRTGRDGLQVGSATSDCTIHHNVIRETGRNNESSHRAGVMNNKGSVCDIYSNVIADTAGWGIYVQGNGSNEIYNNVVARAGRSVRSGDDDGDGISVHDGSNVDGSIYVWNNTVVSARGDGIGWGNDVGSDNQIHNNLVVSSGGTNIDDDEHVKTTHNVTAPDVATAGFVDPAADDYRLRAGSLALDAGTGLRASGVVDDLDGVARPQGAAYDVGAFELPAAGG